MVTPKGEFKTMPAGCTVLDFAFSVHTFLGTHCIGAKVNHKLVGISYVLNSGDQVEILTSKNLVEFFQEHEKEPNSINVEKLCRFHALATREELLSAIGAQTIVLGDADLGALNERVRKGRKWKKYLPFFKHHPEETEETVPEEGETQQDNTLKIDRKKPLILNEETISRYIICDCCHPIPGDDVLGYLDDEQHIIIHKRQCDVAKRLKASDGNHILSAQWDTHGGLSFPATLHIVGFDRVGVLHKITGVLSQQLNINMHSLHIETNDGLFTADINLGVHDVRDLRTIFQDLKKIEEIEDVKRY